MGSVYQKRLTQIFEENRDALLFNDRGKGFCGESCENRDVCFGCRARAYHYTGDVMASDPKCWLNPAAKAYYFSETQRKVCEASGQPLKLDVKYDYNREAFIMEQPS